MSTCLTMGGQGTYPLYSFFRYVTTVLLAIYLLIGNVMLLNLLIAVFTAVFEKIQANSEKVEGT